jgi:hypothetical protein
MQLIDAINLSFYEAMREQSLVDLMEKEREKKGSKRVF